MNSLTPKRAGSDLDWVRGFFGPSFEGFAPRVTRDFHPPPRSSRTTRATS